MSRIYEKGQALVEFAIAVPVLLLFMIGVGYIGNLLLAKQELHTTGYYLARALSLQAMHDPQDRIYARFLKQSVYLENWLSKTKVVQAWKKRRGSFSIHPIVLKRETPHLRKISDHIWLWKTQKTIVKPALPFSITVGVGTLFYGQQLSYAPPRTLSAVRVHTQSVMPTELPLKSAWGILALNPWIKEIVQDERGYYRHLSLPQFK